MTGRSLILPLALGLWASAGTAHAQEARGFYLKAWAGASSLADTDVDIDAVTNTGVSFGADTAAGAALGYRYNDNLSSEIEWSYRSAISEDGLRDGGDFASTSLMLNGVWRFQEFGNGLRPYAGAGLGALTEIDFDLPDGREFSDRGGLAGQVFAGLEWQATERLSAFGEIRYVTAGSVTLDNDGQTLSADYDSVDLLVGLSLSF